MRRLKRDGTAEPVSLDQILRRERRQGSIYFSFSADHKKDWQTFLVDLYSCICFIMFTRSMYTAKMFPSVLGCPCAINISKRVKVFCLALLRKRVL